MAERTTLARPYAAAAFKQAVVEDQLDNWSEMVAFLKAVSGDRSMVGVLADPRVTAERKAELLLAIGNGHLSKTGENFVRVLAANGRLGLLPEICELFSAQMSAHVGRTQVEIIAAFKVSAKFRQMITGAMANRLGREVELAVSEDESLLGGAIIRAGDLVIDASLRGRLTALETSLH